jgi:hypothetical protein
MTEVTLMLCWVLQSCTDSLHILSGASSETFPTSSEGSCIFSNMEVEQDIDVKEEDFMAIKEEADVGIKQEEILEDVSFPDIKAEPVEVSNMCACLILDTLHHCTAMSVVF